MKTILAIVGSTKPVDEEMARILVKMGIFFFQPDEITSGCAEGIDTMAEEEAFIYGIPFTGFPPRFKRWTPEGYRDRNIQVAKHCTHLFRIANRNTTTYGSGWTYDYAKKIGKKVHRVYL